MIALPDSARRADSHSRGEPSCYRMNLVEWNVGEAAGRLIEEYPERERVLVCGPTRLSSTATIYLHVVCEYADPEYVHCVTAYVPDETQWESPPLRRRKKR